MGKCCKSRLFILCTRRHASLSLIDKPPPPPHVSATDQSHKPDLIRFCFSTGSQPGYSENRTKIIVAAQNAIFERKTYQPPVARRDQGRHVIYVTMMSFFRSDESHVDVKNETNKDGSGKGQWSAWKVRQHSLINMIFVNPPVFT